MLQRMEAQFAKQDIICYSYCKLRNDRVPLKKMLASPLAYGKLLNYQGLISEQSCSVIDVTTLHGSDIRPR